MRLQFHKEMYKAYAVLVAASGSVYTAFVVQHFVYGDSLQSPVVVATAAALIVIAFCTAVFIVWRRPKDFAGWIGLVWWGGATLLSLVAGHSR